jgi:hypothetical protein
VGLGDRQILLRRRRCERHGGVHICSDSVGKSARISAVVAPSARLASTVRSVTLVPLSGLTPEAIIEELPDLQLEDVPACLR